MITSAVSEGLRSVLQFSYSFSRYLESKSRTAMSRLSKKQHIDLLSELEPMLLAVIGDDDFLSERVEELQHLVRSGWKESLLSQFLIAKWVIHYFGQPAKEKLRGALRELFT